MYINQPRGYEIHGRNTHVFKLKKALYKPKQAPGAWYSHVDGYLSNLGFAKIAADPNLYDLFDKSDLLVLVLYVDDLNLTGSNEKVIAWCKGGVVF